MTAPSALDAERAVLGACFLDPDVFTRLSDRLSIESFNDARHRRVFAACAEIAAKGGKPDLVSLTEHLRADGGLDAVDGASYLSSLLNEIVTTAHADEHAAILLDRQLRRRLVAIGSGIVADARSARTGEESLERARHEVFAAGTAGESDAESARAVVRTTYKHVSEMAGHGGARGVPTGYGELDKMFSGFEAGMLYVLAGRPSMGKTALGCNCVVHALRAGYRCLVMSLEMTKQQLTIRLMASEAALSSRWIQNGELSDGQWTRLAEACGRISEWPLMLDDSSSLRLGALISKIRLAYLREPFALLMIDYLQLISGPRSAKSRNEEVEEITRALKGLAKELSVPVLLLSQLSRAVEHRGGEKRPVLADLRDSGSIEQDADVVMFVYRKDYYEDDKAKHTGDAELLVRKNRMGPTGTAHLKFDGMTTTFTEMQSW